MKRQLCWIGALGLFFTLVAWAPNLFGWHAMDGFSGLLITFFLGYCAIILVAQVISALIALRSLLERYGQQQRVSRRIKVR